jgi:hypothetical protein
MSPIINARPGHVNYALNEPVAASQTIRKGDLVKYDASKNIVKAAIGDALVLGFATHAVTTGATVTEKDRCIVDPFHSQSLSRATLKNGATLDRSLVNTSAGFIDEGGEIRIDPAAAVKQVRIVEIVERGITTKDPNELYFEVPDAARTRNGA